MNGPTLHGIERQAIQTQHRLTVGGGAAIEGLPTGPHHAAQQFRAELGMGCGLQDSNARSGANALGLAKGHEVDRLFLKAHHLGLHTLAIVAHHLANRTQRSMHAAGFQGEADHTHQTALSHGSRRAGSSNGRIGHRIKVQGAEYLHRRPMPSPLSRWPHCEEKNPADRHRAWRPLTSGHPRGPGGGAR